MNTHFDVLIVGAGHGGAQTALMLLQLKYSGRIGIIGDEPHIPYERPPLSKEYLAGEKEFERFLIRPHTFWGERGVSLLLNRRVVAVDSSTKTVRSEDGERFSYGTLVWAAGGSPRMLSIPGAQLSGIQGVRTRADVDVLRARLAAAHDIVIIGGGYIGLETAAVLIKQHKRVVLLEALSRVLARVAGEPLSRFYEGEHRARGVDLRLNACVTAFEGDTHITGVRLQEGQVIPADLVIVGIGIVPSIAPLIAAGARSTINGVHVDGQCRASLPDVFAVGDCAAHDNAFADGATVRLESVQNANDQATTVANAIIGNAHRYQAVPWFWSLQYDLKLQTVGLSNGFDETVIRGDAVARSFSIVYLKKGRVIALDCVNSVKDYVQGRALILKEAKIPAETLGDSSIPLAAMTADVGRAGPS